MYTFPDIDSFKIASMYRMDYRDLNPSICVVFSFSSLAEFLRFQRQVGAIQEKTLDCLDDELEGHFITFNDSESARSRMRKQDLNHELFSNESNEENEIQEFNLETLYMCPIREYKQSDARKSSEGPIDKINDFEVFESKDTNEMEEDSSKTGTRLQQKESIKQLLRKNSSLSQKSWTEIKRFQHSRDASGKQRAERQTSTINSDASKKTPGLFSLERKQSERVPEAQIVIKVPPKIIEKNELQETPESSSQADNSITEIDSIKQICKAMMSTHNSQMNLRIEENHSSELGSTRQRGRMSSNGHFEKIGRDSANSGIYSTYSNNTNSFRKNSESNGVESLEDFRGRKSSYHSGLEGDSFVIEDNWVHLGTMKSSGNQNAAHSNMDLDNLPEQPKRMTHDFSKRNLAQKKRKLEEHTIPHQKYNFHSSKNSLNREVLGKQLEMISKNYMSNSRNYSSNNDLRIVNMEQGASKARKKKPICKVDSNEFILPSYTETDSVQTLGQVSDTKKSGHKQQTSQILSRRADSFTKIVSCGLATCSRLWHIGECGDSCEFNCTNMSELETPPPSAERKKELKKSLETVRA